MNQTMKTVYDLSKIKISLYRDKPEDYSKETIESACDVLDSQIEELEHQLVDELGLTIQLFSFHKDHAYLIVCQIKMDGEYFKRQELVTVNLRNDHFIKGFEPQYNWVAGGSTDEQFARKFMTAMQIAMEFGYLMHAELVAKFGTKEA